MLMFLSVIDSAEERDLLEQIYIRYKKELFYIAYDILKDPYEAEDVMQSTMIKFVDYLDRNMKVDCHKTRGLLVIIVRSLSINIYNQRKNRETILVDSFDEMVEDQEEYIPENMIIRLDNIREIAEALSRMNAGYADILSLKYVYEYTNIEIASILSISEENVRQRLFRAKKALSIILTGGDLHV